MLEHAEDAVHGGGHDYGHAPAGKLTGLTMGAQGFIV